MPFITPWILLGALAGLIPVAIHFFFRSRYRTVPWAAMKFLLTSVEQTSRRVKFQEYLLLLTPHQAVLYVSRRRPGRRPINLSTPGFFTCFAVVAFTIFGALTCDPAADMANLGTPASPTCSSGRVQPSAVLLVLAVLRLAAR